MNILLMDRLKLELNDQSGPEVTRTEGPNIPVMFKRHMLNGSFVFGAGVKYKLGKNFVLLDLRYMRGLTNVVVKELNHYNENGTLSDELTRYAYVSPLFKVDSYSMSIGFVRPLYDPRKVSKAKTKGVSRKLSRE
jgi:hypothetical protein